MFVPESIDDIESELGREFLPNHSEWQGTKVERKRVEEGAVTESSHRGVSTILGAAEL